MAKCIPAGVGLVIAALSLSPAWAQEAPVLYGGRAIDAAVAQQAALDAADGPTDDHAGPRWFLEPVNALLPGLVVLGPASFTPCNDVPISHDELEAQTAAGLEQLDLILPAEASATLDEAATRLPCLDTPPTPAALADLHFARGIAALLREDRDVDIGRAAFEAAITATPDLPWDEDYPAFPRSVFFEAKVHLLTMPRARIWVPPSPDLHVYLEGHALSHAESGTEVLAGDHLLHVTRGDRTWSGAVTLEPGSRLVIGAPEELWHIVAGEALTDDTASRAFTARKSLVSTWGENVLITRPGASALLDLDGVLSTWSDEGRYRPRLRIEVLGGWFGQDTTIDAPPVDIDNPSPHWAAPRIGVGLQFTRLFTVRLVGGFAWSGPFNVNSEQHTKWMGLAMAGVGVETQEGRVHLGGRVDLTVLFPGQMPIGSEQSVVLLAGGMLSGTATASLTEGLWLVAEAGVGWVGTETGSVALGVQIRLPPL